MDAEAVEKIKDVLKTKIFESAGIKASGCINQGEAYNTDNGLVFIKKNNHKMAKLMFESEFASLNALEKTQTIRVPHPIHIVEGSGNTFYCILEFVSIKKLSKFSEQFGINLAKLHLHNENVAKNNSQFKYVSQFGFNQTTCVGLHPTSNTWNDNWPNFYTMRLQEQVERTKNKEAMELFSKLRPLIPKFFENIVIVPSLLHGDLWNGNVGETNIEPIVYDPGCVYGHHEFDLAMTTLFGGFNRAVYDSYHKYIPKAAGFNEREKLYHLFHYLNHWNHFQGNYKQQSLNVMKNLLKTKFPIS